MNNVAEGMFFIYKLLAENEYRSSSRFFWDHMLQCLNRSANEVLRNTGISEIYRSSATQNLTADTAVYAYPSGILDRRVHSVWWYDGSRWYRLTRKTMQWLELESDTWRSDPSGRPEYWMPDPEQNKIRIYPTPNSSYTNGLRVEYIPKHPHLYRFWGTVLNSSLTVAVTNGSTAATLSIAATDDVFQDNDWIGIITPKPSSTTGIEERTARRFFQATVDDVDATILTLDSAWDGADDATAYFVAGQGIEILERHEDLDLPLFGNAALLLAQIADEPELEQKIEKKYMAWLMNALRTLQKDPVQMFYETQS